MIIAVYKSKGGNISYSVTKEDGDFIIEAEILGGNRIQKSAICGCCEEKAVDTAKLLAKNEVHPIHIEDIISDFRF